MRGCAVLADLQRDLLFAAVTASGVPTLLLDAGRSGLPIVHANRALAEFSGVAVDQLVGRDLLSSSLLGIDAEAIGALQKAAGQRVTLDLELPQARAEGTRARVVLRTAPLQDRDGRVYFLLASCHAAPAETEARTTLRELHGRARSVAHEFNNLLTVIRSSLEPLRQTPADARASKRLERIAMGVDGITQLVSGFLAEVRRAGEPEPTDAATASKLPRARIGEKILLLEPDEIVRLQGSSMLAALGYGIEAVADAETAVQWLSGPARVNLMMLDQQVQCADGTALAERVRQIRRGLPVLFTVDAKRLQGAGTVAKPFQLLALARAVRDSIDRGGKP